MRTSQIIYSAFQSLEISDPHTRVLTVRQRVLGLAVEHDVDAGEGNVSEQSGCETGEQRSRPLCPTHTAQSSCYTAVVITPTLDNTHTHVKTEAQVCTHTLQVMSHSRTSKRVLMTVTGSMQTPATQRAPAPSSMASTGCIARSQKKCCFTL